MDYFGFWILVFLILIVVAFVLIKKPKKDSLQKSSLRKFVEACCGHRSE